MSAEGIEKLRVAIVHFISQIRQSHTWAPDDSLETCEILKDLAAELMLPAPVRFEHVLFISEWADPQPSSGVALKRYNMPIPESELSVVRVDPDSSTLVFEVDGVRLALTPTAQQEGQTEPLEYDLVVEPSDAVLPRLPGRNAPEPGAVVSRTATFLYKFSWTTAVPELHKGWNYLPRTLRVSADSVEEAKRLERELEGVPLLGSTFRQWCEVRRLDRLKSEIERYREIERTVVGRLEAWLGSIDNGMLALYLERERVKGEPPRATKRVKKAQKHDHNELNKRATVILSEAEARGHHVTSRKLADALGLPSHTTVLDLPVWDARNKSNDKSPRSLPASQLVGDIPGRLPTPDELLAEAEAEQAADYEPSPLDSTCRRPNRCYKRA